MVLLGAGHAEKSTGVVGSTGTEESIGVEESTGVVVCAEDEESTGVEESTEVEVCAEVEVNSEVEEKTGCCAAGVGGAEGIAVGVESAVAVVGAHGAVVLS